MEHGTRSPLAEAIRQRCFPVFLCDLVECLHSESYRLSPEGPFAFLSPGRRAELPIQVWLSTPRCLPAANALPDWHARWRSSIESADAGCRQPETGDQLARRLGRNDQLRSRAASKLFAPMPPLATRCTPSQRPGDRKRSRVTQGAQAFKHNGVEPPRERSSMRLARRIERNRGRNRLGAHSLWRAVPTCELPICGHLCPLRPLPNFFEVTLPVKSTSPNQCSCGPPSPLPLLWLVTVIAATDRPAVGRN